MDDLFEAYASSGDEGIEVEPASKQAEAKTGSLRDFLETKKATSSKVSEGEFPQVQQCLMAVKKDRKEILQLIVNEGRAFMASPQVKTLKSMKPQTLLRRDESAGPLLSKPYESCNETITYKTLRPTNAVTGQVHHP
eukprot:Blabericola_migrator_1__7646@NODE_3902_length_1438_cov_5_165573_g2412_i0_p2_GENE_NODE_3902_length_1438_cov_5_165573_g2412_i0NODE_3902_length_1438_cov_5_165573_g2412_i0_p2_ORF_typecomplete_len137_score17_87_NODE_3902_length_1438_cov_5_165573_g2412_i010271437